MKRPNLHLIGVPECDRENESKLENTPQDITQENFPNLARQANIQVHTQNTTKIFLKKRNPKAHIVRFTRVEIKEKMLRAAREKGQVTCKREAHQTHNGSLSRNPKARRQWGPIFTILKGNNFQPRISYPAKLNFISEGKIKSFMEK